MTDELIQSDIVCLSDWAATTGCNLLQLPVSHECPSGHFADHLFTLVLICCISWSNIVVLIRPLMWNCPAFWMDGKCVETHRMDSTRIMPKDYAKKVYHQVRS